MRRVYLFSIIASCLLAACGQPASKAQIERAFSNVTIYNDTRTQVAYQSSSGKTFEVVTKGGFKRRVNGRWYAKDGKLCHSYPSNSCIGVFVSEGRVQPPFGYKVAKGDVFGLARKTRKTTANGVNLKKVLKGVAGAIATTCKNGGCSGPVSTPVSTKTASGGQCKVSKQQCYASCEGLSNEGSSILTGDIGSPKRACKSRCAKIRC